MFYEAKCECGCFYITNDDIKRLKNSKCYNCNKELKYIFGQGKGCTDKDKVKTADEKTLLNFKVRELK